MKEPKIQNSIRLISTQVFDLNMSTREVFDKRITEKLTLNINHAISYPPDNNKNFVVVFDVHIFDSKEVFSLRTKYAVLFESNFEITESNKASDFIIVNSPAIAFPYLRSFITNLTLSAGFNPVIFPAMNFTK